MNPNKCVHKNHKIHNKITIILKYKKSSLRCKNPLKLFFVSMATGMVLKRPQNCIFCIAKWHFLFSSAQSKAAKQCQASLSLQPSINIFCWDFTAIFMSNVFLLLPQLQSEIGAAVAAADGRIEAAVVLNCTVSRPYKLGRSFLDSNIREQVLFLIDWRLKNFPKMCITGQLFKRRRGPKISKTLCTHTTRVP